MTSFCELSLGLRIVFGAWSLLLVLAGLSALVLSFAERRFRIGLAALLPMLSAFLLWQETQVFLYPSHLAQVPALALRLGEIPWSLWLLALLALTPLSLLPVWFAHRYAGSHITLMNVEHCADELPCAICYWRENGRVVFANSCARELCRSLTGAPLMDGNRFRAALGEGVAPVGDRVWSVALRDLSYEGQPLCELVATDITALHAANAALEQENERLSALKAELEEYNRNIDGIVRGKEILQAKMNIHDEMNHLLLSTLADREDLPDRTDVFSRWERNALLLCLEAEEIKGQGSAADLDRLAQALNIHLTINRELSAALNEKQRELVFTTAREALANAAKHAAATAMDISFEETTESLCCSFRNNGTLPNGEIRFTGGLLNLSRLAAEQGAALSAEPAEQFTLRLCFPKAPETEPESF